RRRGRKTPARNWGHQSCTMGPRRITLRVNDSVLPRAGVSLLRCSRRDLLAASLSQTDPKETNSVSGCCNALAQVLQARTLFPRSQKGTLIRRRLAAAHTFVLSLAGHRQARRA